MAIIEQEYVLTTVPAGFAIGNVNKVKNHETSPGPIDVQFGSAGGSFKLLPGLAFSYRESEIFENVRLSADTAGTYLIAFAQPGDKFHTASSSQGGSQSGEKLPTRYMDAGPFTKINSGGFLYASSTIPSPGSSFVPIGSRIVGINIHFPLTDVPGTPIPNDEWAWVKISPGAEPPTAVIIGALQAPGSTVYFPLQDDPAETMLVWIATPTGTEVKYPVTWVSEPTT